MLEIVVPETELFDSITNTFVSTKKTTLQLEHSLLSISKWESRHLKPFLGDGTPESRFTHEEFLDYIKDMTLTKNVDLNVYHVIAMHPDLQKKIADYIDAPMTATTFSNTPVSGNSNKVITAEIIYWQMTTLNIPFECQKWHLNRLMTLIRVCSIKQQKPEKMPYGDMVAQRKALNAQRRAAHRSKG